MQWATVVQAAGAATSTTDTVASTELGILIGVGVLLVVAAAAAVGPRLKVPPPLILVAVGIGISLLPFVQDVSIPPELVLTGVLPPLLYASSVSTPAMDLRREFGAISGLSVLLVVASALLLGWLFTVLIPGLPYAWGVALGAVVSPTDAVATSIVKGTSVSRRVTAILEGESLLNDASALVLLRTAIAGAAASVSLLGVLGDFVWAVVGAAVIGFVVGRVTLWLRSKVTDSTVNTVISFTVPFLAALPAEALGASGLVAAVAAGLVVGRGAPRRLSPQHRRSDAENWSAVSLVLEGAIFLAMGLQISGIVNAAGGTEQLAQAAGLALAALAGVIVIRAAFVAPLLFWLDRRSRGGQRNRERLEQLQSTVQVGQPVRTPRGRRTLRQSDLDRFGKRIRQALADIDYLAASPLKPKDGVVVVWAGLRGAVTVAAAQTITAAAPEGSLLILVAFGVAAISLIVQGGTLAGLIRVLKPSTDDPATVEAEHAHVLQLVRDSAAAVPETEGEAPKQRRLKQIHASRDALLEARDEGVFSGDILGYALSTLDASEIALELQGGPQG